MEGGAKSEAKLLKRQRELCKKDKLTKAQLEVLTTKQRQRWRRKNLPLNRQRVLVLRGELDKTRTGQKSEDLVWADKSTKSRAVSKKMQARGKKLASQNSAWRKQVNAVLKEHKKKNKKVDLKAVLKEASKKYKSATLKKGGSKTKNTKSKSKSKSKK